MTQSLATASPAENANPHKRSIPAGKSRRLRVLQFYRTYFPDTQGGLEETIRQICLNTKPHGIENRILTLSHKPSPRVIRREEAVIYRARNDLDIASCSMGITAFRQFKKLAQWADIIHYHFPWPFADMVNLVSATKKPSIVTYHSDIVRQRALNILYSPLRHHFLSKVDRIIATSPNYFASSPIMSQYSDKVGIIPIGLNENTYPEPPLSQLRQASLRYGKNFFLFIGVLRYYKGLHILLEAMAGAPYKVIITGSGPIEAQLRAQAQKLQLDNVIFTGYVSDAEKRSLLSLCKAVVFPSYLRSEAFGVTLLEGAMFSKPLISTEVGSGTSHVNIDGQTGLVVTPGSPAALKEAMQKIWSDDAAARRMGRQARKRYEQLFTGTAMGSAYAKEYAALSLCWQLPSPLSHLNQP